MRRLFAAGAAVSILMLVAVPFVLGAELTGGCVLEVRSYTLADAQGDVVDEGRMAGIVPEGQKGDDSNPFKVDLDGSVDFFFSTGTTVFQNNTWSIYAQGIPIPLLTGFDDNPMDVDEAGVVNLNNISEALPFEVAGTFFVHGDLWGNNNTNHCHGEGYVKVGDSPLTTPLGLIAAALVLLGGSMLAVAVPYSRDWEVDPIGGEYLHTGPIDQEPTA
jgi:hypothetical protein